MKFMLLSFQLLLVTLCCKPQSTIQPISPIVNNSEYLKGTWQNIHSSAPDFRLDGDSVIYLQEDPSIKYKYELKSDSLIFHFPKFDYAFRLYSYLGDSIHLDSEMNSNTFRKVK